MFLKAIRRRPSAYSWCGRVLQESESSESRSETWSQRQEMEGYYTLRYHMSTLDLERYSLLLDAEWCLRSLRYVSPVLVVKR